MHPHYYCILHLFCHNILLWCMMLVVSCSKVHACEACVYAKDEHVGIWMGLVICQTEKRAKFLKICFVERLVEQWHIIA